jgi:hypothetical protein
MGKGFSIINILIVVGLIALVYLSYGNYIKKEAVKQQNQNEENSKLTNGGKINVPEDTMSQQGEKQLPDDELSTEKETTNLIQTEQEQPSQPKSEQPTKPEDTETKDGFYQNNTYHYTINYPPSWPLRIRSEENISIGTVPPKNGQGAITIEISKGSTNNEINQIKSEAKKYPGIINIEENPITLSGVTGIELTLHNLIINTKDIYILLEKYGYSYAIKYSEESEEFTNQVNNILQTFKFTE